MKKSRILLLGILILLLFSAVTAKGAVLAEPVVASEAAVVMDSRTGEILYEKNGTVKCYPASITKLLTALVAVEKSDLRDTVIFSHDAVYEVEEGSGNPLQLEAGDKLTVEECLYALLLESSNQAANALAEHVAGSLEAFAIYMDTKLDELGCEDSHFVNPSGLHEAEQQTTARDMAVIAKAVFENEVLQEICAAREYQLPPTLNNDQGYLLHMEHQLLSQDGQKAYPYAQAGKTGYTEASGNTLVTTAEKEGKELIAVVLKSEQTHYEDTVALFEYGFARLAQEEKAGTTIALTKTEQLSEEQAERIPVEKEEDETAEQNAAPVDEPAQPVGISWMTVTLVILFAILGFYGLYLCISVRRERLRRMQARRRRAEKEAAARVRRRGSRMHG